MAEKKNPIAGLKRFEGRDVLASTIKVTNAGDGLSEALSVDPAEYELHDTVYVVLECEVSRVSYEDMPKVEGASRRVQTLKTQHAAIVDGQAVAAMLAETKRKIAIKREQDEAEKGIIKLPGTSVEDEGSE